LGGGLLPGLGQNVAPQPFFSFFSSSSFSFLISILTFAKELQNWFKLIPIICKFFPCQHRNIGEWF
jgi:hypothetical protein